MTKKYPNGFFRGQAVIEFNIFANRDKIKETLNRMLKDAGKVKEIWWVKEYGDEKE